MSDYFSTCIARQGQEIEVTAKLYDHGKVDSGYDRWTGGKYSYVNEDPIFTEYVAFDDYGVELSLTQKEIRFIEKRLIEAYWANWQPE